MGAVYLGTYEPPKWRVLIVASRFNELVVDPLVEGAKRCLVRHGMDEANIDLAYAPGAAELPLLAKVGAKSGRYGAIICLGAVIRGATSHYDVVVSSMASGILNASLESEVPVIMGVLTTDSIEQALERAGTKAGNKGFDAAMAALEMRSVMDQIQS
ncbi:MULTISPECIES: 6,7-dimethyl-8-ribityllumazine synthase [Acidithrix]|uniref:6,7-dimethyl-8-ribityllumazine synthase n=1 Tax=Acidithrix ferrooxidans TaxID=1280514 RepID=A0A0D8HF98_9ACTN|nr:MULTISPECIES: 6,7-dimethyl-8-ribityllumazine synthase [Acidithrix]KJF16598.1 6,7-dimethyl-8-ribityllumazine synthase [Acidithrix ferrooxidans]